MGEPTQQTPFVVATEVLREKIRKYTLQQREIIREKEIDALRFGLGEIQAKVEMLDNLTEKDVNGLALRIKRRKHATVEDMYRLNHAFLQGIENINTFANIPGAIQVIVKELTGSDAERQVSAVECLCNLSLGEAAVCEKITNMAGNYLALYLNTTEERLKRTALWTLANMLATVDSKSSRTLAQMELLPKLWNLYLCDDDNVLEYCEDAAICLQLLICHNPNKQLRSADERFLKENFTKKNPTAACGEYHLQFIFHSNVIIHPEHLLTKEQLLYLINYSLNNLINSNTFTTNKERLRVLYAIRVLANLMATYKEALPLLLQQISIAWQTNIVMLLNKIFAYSDVNLNRETFWLLRNLLLQQESQGNTVIEISFLDKLCINKNACIGI